MSDSSERFAAAFEEFHELCDLRPDDQTARLDALALRDAALHREVLALLQADRATEHPLDGPALDAVTGLGPCASAADAPLPERIGEFEVLGLLGEGGMGLVYEARQAVPDRVVALKLVRPGLVTADQLRRFEHEASVLGWLSHPGIAQIYAAGTAQTDAGRQPYIAMELVRGERIDRHAEAGDLAVDARLALVAELCDAVQHAHQKGVVHRDLKPANVLVTADGHVKVLDFGVARITDSDLVAVTRGTEVGEVLGTLPYMSPEQIGGDPAQVDTRSDVYALGVIAYELLAGSRPLEVARRSLAEAARIITEEEPTTLGHIDRRFRGDVETIVGKALEKNKDRRYASAEELAGDLRRHLADEPIQARAPSRSYQLRKFAARNRGLVAGLALAFLVLAAGAATSTALFLDSQRNLTRAQDAEAEWRSAAVEADREATVAREVSDFLAGIFEVSDPSGDAGATITAVDLLDRGRSEIGERLSDQPEVRAELMNTMARVYFNLGQRETAGPLLDASIATLRATPGADPLELATALFSRGEVHHYAGELTEVEPYYLEALELRESALPAGDLLIARTLDVLGRLYRDFGGAENAERSQEFAERAQRMRLAADASPLELSESLQSLAFLAQLRGELEEAERLYREALDVRLAIPGAEFHVPELRHSLALICAMRDRPEEAEALLREGLAEARAVCGERHVFVAHYLSALGSQHYRRGEREEAEALFLEALDLVEDEESPLALNLGVQLAFLAHDRGELDVAEALYRTNLEVSVRSFGANSQDTLVHRNNLAMLLRDKGEHGQALDLFEAVVAGHERGGLRNQAQSVAVLNLAYCLHLVGEQERALLRAQDARAMAVEIYGEDSQATRNAQGVIERIERALRSEDDG